MKKIISIVCLYLFVISPAMAIQHWMHEVGRAHTDALGVAFAVGSTTPPTAWKAATNTAVRKWAKTDINPFKQTAGFENITVYQDPADWESACNNGIACTSVEGGDVQGGNRECRINLNPEWNSLASGYMTMAMLHEIGHCYSLAHNDQFMMPNDGIADEDIEVSEAELMHQTGCPGLDNICLVTDQAKNVINGAY